METIFHEKQEGSLCAQHCLNALLQESYFTAVDLATLAQQMDEEERSRMAEGGIHSEAYQKFMEQPSCNVDDSGYFSVQVIASALKVWSLELIPLKSQHSAAKSAREDPTRHKAYICNYRDHWLTVRKIGHQWFNLNSLLSGPELISDTYLSLFIAQLQEEGYSIFIVLGILPDCLPDRELCKRPAVQTEKPKLLSEIKPIEGLTDNEQKEIIMLHDQEDKTLQETLKLSLERTKQMEDQQLQAALSLSLNECQDPTSSISLPSPFLGTSSTHPVSRERLVHDMQESSPEDLNEQEMLEIALKMSMES